MGQFLSKRHQEQNHPYHHRQQYNYHHHPPPPPTHPPPPPTQPPPLPVPQTYGSTSTVAPQHQPPPPPGPPPPYTPQVYNNYNYNYSRMPPPPQVTHQSYQYPYYVGQSNGWFQPPGVMLHPPPPMPLLAPVPYVDHQSAKKIKNDVNVHKDTIKLEVDEDNKDFHLVSFTFDALVDGSITIYYFAKEGANCSFTPLYPEIHVPVKVPFQQGSGQKFRQPSGSGIDLGFFDINDLSKPSVGDIFPLVISAETYASASTSSSKEEEPVEGPSTSPHAQITQAVIEKDNESHFRVKVMKQILWIDQVRYELREIFGMSDSSDETTINDNKDLGQECVICLTEPRDTAVLPCRHMCMCRGCANELRLQSNTCPICRQPIQELLEIKVVEEGKQNTQ